MLKGKVKIKVKILRENLSLRHHYNARQHHSKPTVLNKPAFLAWYLFSIHHLNSYIHLNVLLWVCVLKSLCHSVVVKQKLILYIMFSAYRSVYVSAWEPQSTSTALGVKTSLKRLYLAIDLRKSDARPGEAIMWMGIEKSGLTLSSTWLHQDSHKQKEIEGGKWPVVLYYSVLFNLVSQYTCILLMEVSVKEGHSKITLHLLCHINL